MDARVLLVCLLVAVTVHGEQAPIGMCRSTERFLACGCPRTCRDPAPDCRAVCRTGCFCEEGQVRNDDGICVNLADCPPILSAYKQDTTEPRPNGSRCRDNEEYRFCEPCNRSCDNPNPVCPAQCSRGCFCRRGLLRDRDGTCVTPDKCSKNTK
ncbi:hypothetical protein PYW07_005417 [Mythimna separata]|uniref:TIL domain-containing protein n=1 Tax=Mythimna separata TaxID=271217 RepID=A0AAD7YEG2_MYTSE|nr:hypothetical protein PYW07_005417 [Mythimna separata]